jgi:hypothetical protein
MFVRQGSALYAALFPGRRVPGAHVRGRRSRFETAHAASPRRHHRQVIELRFFGGLIIEETAAVLGFSPHLVMRDWKVARDWLARELRDS